MRHVLLIAVTAVVAGALAGAVAGWLSSAGEPALDEDALRAVIRPIVEAALEDRYQATLSATETEAMIEATVAEAMAAGIVGDSDRIVAAYARVAPSIVIIDAEGPERTREDGVIVAPAALGSGFVLDNAGHIVTVAHVLEGMTTIQIITADGERRLAELVSHDQPFSDVAVLRTDPTGLIAAPFGRSADLKVGQTVLAIGNILLGQELAMTMGIVSDPDTTFFRERLIQERLIQTDAALNHGNSGGALVSLDGEVVGMTAVIARETKDGDFVDGVGFAIQIDSVLDVARGIARDGYYPRPTFGVVDERLLTPAAAVQLNLEVTEGSFLIELKRNGAFARAGIRPGDVIRELAGVQVNAENPFVNVLARLEPNVPVRVRVHRFGEERTLMIAPDLREP